MHQPLTRVTPQPIAYSQSPGGQIVATGSEGYTEREFHYRESVGKKPTEKGGQDFWAIALFLAVVLAGTGIILAVLDGVQAWGNSQQSSKIQQLENRLELIKSTACK